MVQEEEMKQQQQQQQWREKSYNNGAKWIHDVAESNVARLTIRYTLFSRLPFMNKNPYTYRVEISVRWDVDGVRARQRDRERAHMEKR